MRSQSAKTSREATPRLGWPPPSSPRPPQRPSRAATGSTSTRHGSTPRATKRPRASSQTWAATKRNTRASRRVYPGGPDVSRPRSLLWKSGHWGSLPASTPAWACNWRWPTSWAFHRSASRPAEGQPHSGAGGQFLARLDELGIRITVVFGGFEGESYADIPAVARTVGLVPPATARPGHAGDEGNCRFCPAAGRGRRGAAPGFRTPRRGRSALRAGVGRHSRHLRPLPDSKAAGTPGDWPGIGRHAGPIPRRRRARQSFRQFRSGQHDSLRLGRPDPPCARWAAACGASTARTPSGRPGPAPSGAAKSPWARATWAWRTSSARWPKSATTAP